MAAQAVLKGETIRLFLTLSPTLISVMDRFHFFFFLHFHRRHFQHSMSFRWRAWEVISATANASRYTYFANCFFSVFDFLVVELKLPGIKVFKCQSWSKLIRHEINLSAPPEVFRVTNFLKYFLNGESEENICIKLKKVVRVYGRFSFLCMME